MKPQDVMVALKLCLSPSPSSYSALAESLGMSASEVHAAVRRLVAARLVDAETKSIRRQLLRKFLVHGAPHAFAARTGEVTRGMPTAWAAPAMQERFSQSDPLPPVWPDPEGAIRGVAVKPLYRSAAKAARADSDLYNLLALVDALRIGRARERRIAEEILVSELSAHV